MDTDEQATIWARPTPSGWLAASMVFPRIAVVGATESDARQLLDARCAWWRALPVPDEELELTEA